MFNKKKTSEKLKKAVALVLCFACTFSAAAFFKTEDSYADTGTSSGYKWTRVYSLAELRKAIDGKSDGKLNDDDKKSADEIYNTWTRVMIVYDNKYFSSQANGADDNENWQLRKILPSYDIDPYAESFVTRTGLDTPFIKYSNSGDEYYFRFCQNGTDLLSGDILALHINWYGVKGYCEVGTRFAFNSCARANDVNYGKKDMENFWASSSSRYSSVKVHFTESWKDYLPTGLKDLTQKQYDTLAKIASYTVPETHFTADGYAYTVYVDPGAAKKYEWGISASELKDTSKYDLSILDKIYYDKEKYPTGISGKDAYVKVYDSIILKILGKVTNGMDSGCAWMQYDIPGTTDRYWGIEDGDEICSAQYEKNRKCFKIFLGEKYSTPSYTGDGEELTLVPGTTVFHGLETIGTGYTINVNYGSTLIIDGHAVNNGIINVNGGTLLIRDCLETDVNEKGQIQVKNGGNVLVEKTGVILGRGGSLIELRYESSLNIYGCVACSKLTLDRQSMARVAPGALLATGVSTKNSVEYNNLTADALKKYQTWTLSSFFEGYNPKNDPGNDANVDIESSLISDGAFILAHNKIGFYGDHYYDAFKVSDLGNTVKHAMRNW